MIPLVLYGAAGRMGKAVEDAVRTNSHFRIKARVDTGPSGGGSGVEKSELPVRGDVVIDFSSPSGFVAACRVCRETGAALVSGTTGLGAAEEQVLRETAAHSPVLHATNFSLGVVVLRRALEAALRSLPAGWDVEILERHHRGKADAPSGTALTLAREVAAARGFTEESFRNGRSGRTGARPEREIGIHAVRGGTWVGDHQVLLAGEGEWLELRHVAQDRGAFAQGALAAANFVAGAGPGLYNLFDVIGSKTDRGPRSS